MKNLIHILFVLISVLFCCNSFSQGFNVSLHTGLNTTRLSDNYIQESRPSSTRVYQLSNAAGVHFGVYGEYNIIRHLAIQSGIGFRASKHILSDLASEEPYTYEYYCKRLSVPLTLKFKLSGLGLYAGAQMDVATFYEAQEPGDINHKTIDFPDVEKDFYTKRPVVGVVGIEYTARGGFGFGFRYMHDFNPLLASYNSLIPGKIKQIKTKQFELGMHWRFGKDKSRTKKE